MTLQTQQPTTDNLQAVLTDEQRRRVADALESAQSENTRKNYASQFGKFRSWCDQEDFSYLPAQPEVLAAYAAELADDGKSMSTIRLAVAADRRCPQACGTGLTSDFLINDIYNGLSRAGQ